MSDERAVKSIVLAMTATEGLGRTDQAEYVLDQLRYDGLRVVPARPGRWLVEIGDDGYILWSRIGPDDKAHGGSGEDFRMPGVNAWLDEQRAGHPSPEPPSVGLLEYEWRRPDGVVLERLLIPEDKPFFEGRANKGTYGGEHYLCVRYQVPGAIWQHVRHFDAVRERPIIETGSGPGG